MVNIIMGFPVMDNQWHTCVFCQINLPGIMFQLDLVEAVLLDGIKTDFTKGDNFTVITKFFQGEKCLIV